ncbi:MAG: RNA polymerase subunit sigma-70 [Streptosporangiaceae bacterium]
MSADHARADERALLDRARAGDEAAFTELVGAHHSELRAHCYRMLGSVHDAEDAVQDALLRAWRGVHGFEGRSSVRSWLYSIATNTALDVTRHKSRRELPVSFGPAAPPGARLGESVSEPVWLEPFPDRWLAGASPEARYEQRESVELAFMIMLQQLPPLQRAVLILRDVLGFSPAEMSRQLGTTEASVNSALQRARAAARAGLPARSQQATVRDLGSQRVGAIAARYADAIERGDADTLISMLTEDAAWSMPPIPTWFQGRAAIRDWLNWGPLAERWQHRATWANGQLAVGCYLDGTHTGRYLAAVLDVLTLDGDRIAAVTGFLVPGRPDPVPARPAGAASAAGAEIFARFGLPAALP